MRVCLRGVRGGIRVLGNPFQCAPIGSIVCAIMSTVDLTIDEEPREEQPAPPEDLPPQPISDNVSSGPNPRPVTLPVSRIKTIMKSCPDTSMVSQEAAVLVTKSTVKCCSIWA